MRTEGHADFRGGVLSHDSVAPIATSLALEAFMHMRTEADAYGAIIATMCNQFGGHHSQCSWGLVVRYDRLAATQPRERAVHLYENCTGETVGSGFILYFNYDIAAAFDLPDR